MTLGGATSGNTTIKAEARQLVLHNVTTRAGESTSRSFLVNVRTPRIDEQRRVGIKEREADHLRWDEKLTLEFNGTAPAVRAVDIIPVPEARVVYLVGDSTVCDQGHEPWNSWGQMLPAMLDLEAVAIANHAESGETYTDFVRSRRWDKVLSTLRAGDVVLMQMGHNDMKEKGEGAGAYLNYSDSMRKLIKETRERGATAVLLTPVHRRAFDGDRSVKQTLGDYPDAVRKVSQETSTALIDLNARSEVLYEFFGKEGSAALFVDGTHHNNYGSYLLARCVADGLRECSPELAALVKADLPPFDPAYPPAQAELAIPKSPQRDPSKPDGN